MLRDVIGIQKSNLDLSVQEYYKKIEGYNDKIRQS